MENNIQKIVEKLNEIGKEKDTVQKQKKIITAPEQALLDQMKDFMIQQGLTCMQLGDKSWVVIEQHPVKPTLNITLMALLFQEYCKNRKFPIAAGEKENFIKYVETTMAKMTDYESVCKIVHKKPADSFLKLMS